MSYPWIGSCNDRGAGEGKGKREEEEEGAGKHSESDSEVMGLMLACHLVVKGGNDLESLGKPCKMIRTHDDDI